jgi:hypothetical protein
VLLRDARRTAAGAILPSLRRLLRNGAGSIGQHARISFALQDACVPVQSIQGGHVKKSRVLESILGCALLVFALSTSAFAQAKSPTDAYLAFVADAHKATSLDQLLPHLSKEYRSMLESRPADQKPVWLQRLKDSADMSDIKITRETISGSKCALEGTATGHVGPLKGKVSLVQEGGEWKLDEQGWST